MSAHAKPLLMQRGRAGWGGVNKIKRRGGAGVDKRWTPVALSNHAGNAGSPHSRHLRDSSAKRREKCCRRAAVGPPVTTCV